MSIKDELRSSGICAGVGRAESSDESEDGELCGEYDASVLARSLSSMVGLPFRMGVSGRERLLDAVRWSEDVEYVIERRENEWAEKKYQQVVPFASKIQPCHLRWVRLVTNIRVMQCARAEEEERKDGEKPVHVQTRVSAVSCRGRAFPHSSDGRNSIPVLAKSSRYSSQSILCQRYCGSLVHLHTENATILKSLDINAPFTKFPTQKMLPSIRIGVVE